MVERLVRVLLVFFMFAVVAAPVRAATITVKFANGCCCQDAVDCTLSGSANPVCNQGHAITGDVNACGGFFDYFPGGKCFGVGCIGGGSMCEADVGPNSLLSPPPTPAEVPLNGVDDDCDGVIDECTPGESLACTAPVRSCAAPLAGTELCAPNGLPSHSCVVPQASNADFCPKAACLGGVIDNTDTDGDGLLDCWETQGIDYDGDGTVDFTLPGANKNHTDLYVEIDYFDCSVAGGDCDPTKLHTHQPLANTITTITQTYANSPLTNPDGVKGITLHPLVDEGLPHRAACPFDDSCYGAIKQANFGTAAERANQKALLAKRLVYRYSLWIHDLAKGDSTSGISHKPSADTIVSLGSWTNQVGTVLQQSGTFVHELGHDLGLDHGGGDAINFKPNYLSVMNYSFQVTGRIPGNIIDYSTSALPTLDETNLSEPAGIGDGMFNTLTDCPNGSFIVGAGNSAINWDCKPPPDTATDVNVVADINGDRICIDPGKDNVLQSAPTGDDLIAGGFIGAGPNMMIDTVPAGDDAVVGLPGGGSIIVPGSNGRIDTVPSVDDQLLGEVIWDGPNRTCESSLTSDDKVDATDGISRVVGNVEPAMLVGFNDWGAALTFDFTPLLKGFGISTGAAISAPELDLPTARAIETRNTIADLSLQEAISRSSDGTVSMSFTLSNHGPDGAVGAMLNDRLPSSITFVSCAATGGGPCQVNGNYVTVPFPSLASGETKSVTAKGCSVASGAISNVATLVAGSTDPNLADNTATAQLAAPDSLPATQLSNGDMRYAVTFSAAQAYVEAFVRQNGVQTISGNIVGNRVSNPDGTFTYFRVVPASSYHTGDVINVRFYSYRSGQQGVFTPGLAEFLSYPDFIYGSGSTTCKTACRPSFGELPNGDVKVSWTFATAQSYVEAFVRDNNTQVASGNIVQSGVANFDGTLTYTRTIAASNFRTGDHVSFRFYSYINGQPQVFTPGPTQSTWFPGFAYNQGVTSDCPSP